MRNNKSGADFQKDHRVKIELVRACDEERWRTHTEESVEGGYTREEEGWTTENKMERRVSPRFEKYWTESGRGDGQGDVEKKDHQLYRRTYMIGKARGKVTLLKYIYFHRFTRYTHTPNWAYILSSLTTWLEAYVDLLHAARGAITCLHTDAISYRTHRYYYV